MAIYIETYSKAVFLCAFFSSHVIKISLHVSCFGCALLNIKHISLAEKYFFKYNLSAANTKDRSLG